MIGQHVLAWLDQWTLLLVGFVALLLFGRRLPEVARSLGKGISEFKKGLHDVSDEMDRKSPPHEPPPEKLQPPQAKSEPRRLERSEDDGEASSGTRDRADEKSQDAR